MADDGLDGITTPLAFFLDRSHASFLTSENDLGVIDAMAAIAEVDIGLTWLCAGENCGLITRLFVLFMFSLER